MHFIVIRTIRRVLSAYETAHGITVNSRYKCIHVKVHEMQFCMYKSIFKSFKTVIFWRVFFYCAFLCLPFANPTESTSHIMWWDIRFGMLQKRTRGDTRVDCLSTIFMFINLHCFLSKPLTFVKRWQLLLCRWL